MRDTVAASDTGLIITSGSDHDASETQKQGLPT